MNSIQSGNQLGYVYGMEGDSHAVIDDGSVEVSTISASQPEEKTGVFEMADFILGSMITNNKYISEFLKIEEY